MKTKPQTVAVRAVFRMFQGEVVALFPGLAGGVGKPAECLSYAHVGQHGAADYWHVMRASRPATETERAPLAAELARIGYVVTVAKRESAADYAARKRQLNPDCDGRFYEVVLSDCDGGNAVLHVWESGRVDTVKGSPSVVRRLLPLYRDPEAPEWVPVALASRYPRVFGPVYQRQKAAKSGSD